MTEHCNIEDCPMDEKDLKDLSSFLKANRIILRHGKIPVVSAWLNAKNLDQNKVLGFFKKGGFVSDICIYTFLDVALAGGD